MIDTDAEPQVSSRADELVGRAREIAVVRGFIDSIRASPRTLLVEGEAGIGKTSLWRLGVGLARERSIRVISCRPGASEVHLSFSGLGDLVSGSLDAVLPALSPPQRRALESALLLSDPLDVPTDHRSVGLALLGVLRADAAAGPVLVAIDDLQWLDAPSARVLEFALRRLEQEPVAVLASLRSADAPPWSTEFERALPMPVKRIPLAPLGIGALGELLRERLGLTFARPMLVRLHETTGGNPFYALEVGGALHADDASGSSRLPLPVPRPLRELVQRRLGRLPARTRATLLAAAALSQPTVSLLIDWAGSEGAVVDHLERARRAGVIELEDDLIRFSHPLLSSFLYAAAGVSARRRLHVKLAAVVSNPEERARHLGRAATGPDSSVASALRSAARRARARGAPDAALELTEEALRLTPPGRKRERAHLTLGAAEACVAVGDLGRARTLFERVVDEQPAGSLRARALMELARIVDDGEVATQMASQALAEAGDLLPLRMEIKRSAAMRAWATAQHLSIALTHARESLRLAEEVGDNDAYGAALAWVVRFEVMTGQPVRDEFRSHLEAPQSRGGEVIVNGLRYTWAEILLWSDELAQAREIFESLHRDAIARGDFHAVAPVLQILSFVLWRSGDWEAAHRCVEEAEQAARQCADETALAFTLPFRAWIEAQLGRVEAVRTAAGEGRTLIARTHARVAEFLVRAAPGALELSLGQADAALGHLDSLASSRWAAGYRDPWWLFSVPDEVEALVMLGEPERAMMVLEPFERQAEALQRRWALGTAARSRGLLAAAAGDFANAWQAFERALETQRRLGEPFELGRTLMSYGVSRRRAKQRHAARESLAESVAIFDQLGAALWAERARGELARVGGRAADADELTPTERRVAELIAGGRANKEAAAELFVSVKAVEANLSSIYRKLGIRSRTQLARLLTQQEGRQTGGMS